MKSAEKWHDLRKDPDDLPEKTDQVWVVLAKNPQEVEMDSYMPEDKEKYTSVPVYEGGKIVGHKTFLSSGWWVYDLPGEITHWMYIDVPEPPKEQDND